MSRADKQSPHSSPRLTRRCITPNLTSSATTNLIQTNDIYASQTQHHPTQAQSSAMPSATASSTGNNGNSCSSATKVYNAARSSAGSSMQPVCFSQTNLNRMSAPSMSTQQQQHQQSPSSTAVVNKALTKAQSAELNEVVHQDATAPPLPPRKSSPITDNLVNRMLKPPSVPSHSNFITSNSPSSSDNITICDLDVPQSEPPPIPKHNAIKSNHLDHMTLDDELKHIQLAADDNEDKVIVGPAETITGIIDTRPIEARKAIVTSATSDKDAVLVTLNGANNLYHLKVGGSASNSGSVGVGSQQQQDTQRHSSTSNPQRHQSFPGNSNSIPSTASGAHPSMPTKSQTTPHIGMEYVKLNSTTTTSAATSSRSTTNIAQTTNDDTGSGGGTSFNGTRRDGQQQPLLYENITLNNKDCNVPYENINLEYIARLMKEGYSKENVITALGISRNNIEMACDILHEFVSKSKVWTRCVCSIPRSKERFAQSLVEQTILVKENARKMESIEICATKRIAIIWRNLHWTKRRRRRIEKSTDTRWLFRNGNWIQECTIAAEKSPPKKNSISSFQIFSIKAITVMAIEATQQWTKCVCVLFEGKRETEYKS